jgi:hypothetical protein
MPHDIRDNEKSTLGGYCSRVVVVLVVVVYQTSPADDVSRSLENGEVKTCTPKCPWFLLKRGPLKYTRLTTGLVI